MRSVGWGCKFFFEFSQFLLLINPQPVDRHVPLLAGGWDWRIFGIFFRCSQWMFSVDVLVIPSGNSATAQEPGAATNHLQLATQQAIHFLGISLWFITIYHWFELDAPVHLASTQHLFNSLQVNHSRVRTSSRLNMSEYEWSLDIRLQMAPLNQLSPRFLSPFLPASLSDKLWRSPMSNPLD